MAEKQEEEDVPNSSQGLTCPLCLGLFDDATLLTSCGHTFCRTCLTKHDLSHQDLDHMVCPLCRTVTKLSANRVEDLLPNVTVNGLVDDYHVRSGGASAILEMQQKCTVCNLQVEAIAFCSTCDAYMCDQCCVGHEQQKLFFEGHEIVSIHDILEGNCKPCSRSEKCSAHRQENKNIFCQDCKIRVCFKCVIIDHRAHKIQSHQDFEKEMQVKVSELLHRCETKTSELEKNTQTVETHRHEAHSALQLLREDVGQACRTKVKQLEDNRCVLVEKIDVLERSFDEGLNGLISKDRQMIKSICSSLDLVANDRLGCLEADSLAAHTFLCEEIDGLLKEVLDQTSAATIMKKAHKQRFKPAKDTSLDLGNISETDAEAGLDDMLKGASDDTEEVQEKRSQFADEDITTGLSVPEPQSKSQPKVCVIKCLDLREDFKGITKYTNNSVAITYNRVHAIHIFNSDEDVPCTYSNIPNGMKCFDLVFQSDMTLCVSTGNTKVHRYCPHGIWESTTEVTSSGCFLRLSRSQSEILITQHSNHVSIYDPSGNTLKHDVQTRHKFTNHASATKLGLIVTSSSYVKKYDNPRIVMVYDRDGNSGRYLEAPPGANLYPAVDEQDNVYVANVDHNTGQVLIRLYELDGLNLKERFQFNPLDLAVGHGLCRIVSLTPNILAFACSNKLYFLEVKL